MTKNGTIYTTDGSQADVNLAIAAASPGDTVNIPSGSFIWAASALQTIVNKAITLQGAGVGNTMITLDPSAGTYGSATVYAASSGAVIKDFRANSANSYGHSFFGTSGNGWRITNIDYHGAYISGDEYFAYTQGYGLIDHCTITGVGGQSELIFAIGPSDSWQTIDSLGTANALYIEDCIFNGSGYVCDANANARIVVRKNIINGGMKIDMHGRQTSSPRGGRQIEAYLNSWTLTTGYWSHLEIRSGTGVIWGNTTINADSQWASFVEYYFLTVGNGGSGQPASNYPFDDQIGVGMDPKVAASAPYYAFLNVQNGSNWPIGNSGYGESMTGVINPDREYFDYVSSGFNGSTGTGSGTKSAMLAITPTKTGVGYWVTDEASWRSGYAGTSGQLYTWNGSAWVLKYTPLAYPHPMISGYSYSPQTRARSNRGRARTVSIS